MLGCAGELEDAEQYVSSVGSGLGAAGVLPKQGSKTDPDVEPVSPLPSVNPQQSDNESSDEETSSVAPSPSVSPSSGGLSAECADVPTRILVSKCGGDSCHGSPGMPSFAFSDLVSTTDPAILLNVPAKSTCASKMLIDGDNPADSAILSAVQAEGHCSGSRMPFNGPPYLSTDEISCLTEWVNAVAAGEI
jgi:hypothetical protein